MTEGCEDGNSLVRVRAQVMTRDDSSGGWVPMDGGGLSNVSVRKRSLHGHPYGLPASARSSTSGPGPPPPPSPAGPTTTLSSSASSVSRNEYLILGKRISDQSVVLSCIIGKDFQYNKVMPTFHHWKTGDQKYGLAFQTAADARAFDKGVRMAVEDLLDDVRESPALRHLNGDAGEDDVFMTLDLPVERSELQQHSSPLPTAAPASVSVAAASPSLADSSQHLLRINFLNRRNPGLSSSTSSLPLLNDTSKSSSTLTAEQLMWQQRDQELALIRERERAAKEKERQKRERDVWGGIIADRIEADKESYSYVQFAREGMNVGGNAGLPGGGVQALHSLHSLHEYSYPLMPDPVASKLSTASARRGSLSSLKKNQAVALSPQPPLLPSKSGKGKNKRRSSSSTSSGSSSKLGANPHLATKAGGRVPCRHCKVYFRPEENIRGACQDAPDCVRSTIDAVSCIGCAECLLYHCYADAEGDFAPQPCEPDSSCCCPPQTSGKRWIALALLSLVVPCLWCYLPLKACYRCGIKCGCCGQRHEAA